mmetsp:Transcript_21344/g.48059  ORF Transcript_21344/g.48059 Transcript_21344/m.48059 type:complete len:96 (+) Transcript_21344:19-306(+)
MSRAGPRWAGETVMPSVEAPVVLDIDHTLTTLEDAKLRSPGLSKPMQRRYEYIQTPECLGMGAAMSALAEGVHERNLKAKARTPRRNSSSHVATR